MVIVTQVGFPIERRMTELPRLRMRLASFLVSDRQKDRIVGNLRRTNADAAPNPTTHGKPATPATRPASEESRPLPRLRTSAKQLTYGYGSSRSQHEKGQ